MKGIRVFTAVVAILGMNAVAQAGIFNLTDSCGAAKSCGCAPSCQPECCKPTITRPCEHSVHTYQRKCSTIKPPCCPKDCCAPAPKCCAPAAKPCCKPAKPCCKPAAPCCKPAKPCCKPAAPCCKPAKPCCKPAAPCCKPAKPCCKPAAKCCAPSKACCAPKCAAPPKCCKPEAPKCCAPKAGCCDDGGCCDTRCCDADPCEIAELIYQSQTACYAKDRRKAIHKLGDNFDCVCNPEIMVAFVYALNDCDERVRAKAADEIGDQIRAASKDGCCNCCTPEVVAALTCALGDCDKKVRRQAEEGLEACGYEVVDGCCDDGCCDTGCDPCGSGSAPSMEKKAAPAPAPPADDKKAYFPSRLDQRQTLKPIKRRSKLAGLFGLLD